MKSPFPAAALVAFAAAVFVSLACAQDAPRQAATEPQVDIYGYFAMDASLNKRLEVTPLPKDSYFHPLGIHCPADSVLLKGTFEELNRLIGNEKALEAKALGGLLAETAASCAIVFRGKPNAPVGDWAFYAGAGLLPGIPYDSLPTDKLVLRARAYFTYADQQGASGSKKGLAALDQLTAPPQVATGPQSNTATATALVQEQIDNGFSFWKKYEGQRYVVSGEIRSIRETDRGASLELNGAAKSVPRDNQGFGHWIACDISATKDLEKLANFKVGQTARLMGTIRRGKIFKFQITLEGCSVQ